MGRNFDLYDYIPFGIIIIDRNLKLNYCNNYMANILQKIKPGIYGNSALDVFSGLKLEKYRVRLENTFQFGLPLVFSSKLHESFIDQGDTNDKRNYEIKITAIPNDEVGYDALIMLEDVTSYIHQIEERKSLYLLAKEELRQRIEIENALRISEEKFRQIFNHVTDGIVIHKFSTDISEFKILEVNDNACKQTGYTKEEALQLGVFDIADYEKTRDFDNIIKTLLEEGHAKIELELVKKDGKRIQVETNSSKHNFSGEEIIISVIRDITERKEVEKELVRAKDKAEEANKSKSLFLANISHELRTPLNAVLGFSELLKEEQNNDKVTELVKGISTSGKNLSNLINDILDLSKLEAGGLSINKGKVSIRQVISDIAQIFKIKAKSKGIDLTVEISKNIPHLLILDETRIRQVLLNLVGNAVKFTTSGYVNIYADFESNKETSSFTTNKSDFVVQVADSGIGIEKSELKRIFDPFVQVDQNYNKMVAGTGLGLSISNRLIKDMGGSISVESKPNEGSVFTFRIPSIGFNKNSGECKSILTVNSNVRFHHPELLLVEDQKSNREVIKMYLEGNNVNVIEAKNGIEAFEKLDQSIPDIILLDLLMPEMGGEMFLSELNKYQRFRDTKVIVITASVLDRNKFNHDNLTEVLYKPLSKDQLINALMRYLPYDICDEVESDSDTSKNVFERTEDPIFREIRMVVRDPGKMGIEFKDDIIPLFKKANVILEYDQILELSDNLHSYSKKFNLPGLLEFGERLRTAADSFKFDKIEQSMKLLEKALNIDSDTLVTV